MHPRILGFASITIAAASCTASETSTDAVSDVAPSLRVERVELANDGLPYFVRGHLGAVATRIDDARALDDALPAIATMFHVSASDLVANDIRHDRLGMTHVVYVQRKHGLRVVGGDLVVHVAADGTIRSVTGSARDVEMPSSIPSLAVEVAADLARASTADGHVEVRRGELTYAIVTSDGTPYLTWEIEVVGRDGVLLRDLVYVDAHAGRVVDRRPQVFTGRSRTIFDGHGGTYPFVQNTTQVGSEGQPPTDMVARAAYDNTGATYDCYDELYQRDSYDGAGGVLKSLVHVVFFSPNGSTGNNAAWTGNQMVYGDGDGTLMKPLALAFDVTAHELTHGVTSATAKLAYQNESGALNEGMSDIMAAVCEARRDGGVTTNTWLVGEDIFTPATSGDALRYMANPTADASLYPPELGGSRDFYAERYQGQKDNGGVHLNSGIPNLAFQLLVDGGKHPRSKTSFLVPGIGIEKAGAIFQRALTQGYFTSNTNLAQARTATEEVAEELFPGSAKAAVGMAWAAVGVGAPLVDTVPPSVAITSPDNSAAVAAGFAVEVDASDDQAVLRVDLSIDGTVVGTDDSAPYAFATDSALAPGVHTVEATAYDAFNQVTDAITVMVSSGSVCVDDTDCSGGETCREGTCQAGNPLDEDPAGCGCSSPPEPGSLVVLLGTMLVLRRRRRYPARSSLWLALLAWSACAYAAPPSQREDVDAPIASGADAATNPAVDASAMITLSQSSSTTIAAATSVGCIQAGSSRQISYYRVFRLAAHGLAKPFAAQRVDFGVQQVVGAHMLGVKLHVLAGTFSVSHLTTVASVTVPVDSAGSGTMLSVVVDPSAVFEPDATLVAEVALPDAQGTGKQFLLGANTDPETQPGFLRSAACGSSEPTTFAAIGFPDAHIVLTVSGRADP